ncbi:MAG: biotin/lipoyl-containing protein [Verrucomicrobiota bacterium]
MKQLKITVDGKVYDVAVEILDEGDTSAAPAAPARRTAAPMAAARASGAATAAPMPAAAPAAGGGAGDVPSPLAGKVVSVDAPVGTEVKAGDTVMTLEAMMMNTSVSAPQDGKVTAVHVSEGQGVDEGQPLLTIG